MKKLLCILLIILMGIQQKEIDMPMIREDGKTERQARVLKTPAWLGRNPNPPTPPNWGQAGGGVIVRNRLDRLNELGAPTGLGGGNAPVPNYNTPASITQGQQDYAQANNIPRPMAAPTPGMQQAPAWMRGPSVFNPRTGQRDPVQDNNVYNPNVAGVTEQGTPTMGTNSFIGGGGDAVIGIDQEPVFPWMTGTNTFLAANGQAVRGPDFSGRPIAAPAPAPTGGGSGGFGSSYYGNWRRGGGGGGGYGYSDYGDAPAWFNPYMNLYSWNYRG